ncbi:hypothetical protein ACHJH3_06355 [Campylobacter sp. MOP7]|uniref:hypothetical protein n=1 Tax=Campylobacter canis TaxID=3378588 RepID=UPI00387E83BA
MLAVEVFDEYMNRLNSILSKNAMIMTNEACVYYDILKNTNDSIFKKAMMSLIANWSNATCRPTPANIQAEINKIQYYGLSKEEFINVAKSYTLINAKAQDPKLQNLINCIDKEALFNGELTFKPGLVL